MKRTASLLKNIPLFEGIGESEMSLLVRCLGARSRRCAAGDTIIRAGDPVHLMGVVLSGEVHLARENRSGPASVQALGPGQLFEEAYACAGISHSPVTVLAGTDCEIVLLNLRKVLSTCATSCTFHTRLIENLMRAIALQNLALRDRNDILACRSIRDKLLAYLSRQQTDGNGLVIIPLNREELADYLSVDRSALSRELCRLRDEGILQFHKNQFRLPVQT